jgi:DNA-binding transcriptional ArsR family regulator
MGNPEALAAWAALLADRTRASFCLALLDGRAWTVGELARHAGVALSTASEHAGRLVAGGVLVQHRQGRHRYLSLAGPDVAALIEAVAAAAPARPVAVVSMAGAHRQRNLAFARTCYDHLAGRLGVALADAMTGAGLLDWDHGLALTGLGVHRLGELGVDLPRAGRRPALRSCLDWTERRAHLAGAVGAALCRHAFEAGWVVRIGTGRAVRLTPAGTQAFQDRLGVLIEPPAGPDGPGAARAAPAGVHHR